jgi:hypothetical protein
VTNTNAATFKLQRNVHYHVKSQTCRLDTGRWAACHTPVVFRNLADGVHRLQAKLVMTNGSVATASYAWRVDTKAPHAPAVTGALTTWLSAESSQVSHQTATDPNGSGITGYVSRVSNDQGAHWTAGSGSPVTVTREGETWVEYAARDKAGNQSAWTRAIVRLDWSAPTAPSISGGSSNWHTTPATITDGRDSTDALSGVAGYRWRESTDDGQTWAEGVDTAGLTDITSDGVTLVQYQAIDHAGNESAWSRVAVVEVDQTAPSVPSVSGDDDSWRNTDGHVTDDQDSTDQTSGIARYQYRVTINGTPGPIHTDSTGKVTVGAEGDIDVQFRAVDRAGNTSAWSTPAAGAGELRIDKTAPAIVTFTPSTNGWSNQASETMTFTTNDDLGSDNHSGVDYIEYATSPTGDDGTFGERTDIQNGDSATVTDEGSTYFGAVACDKAGNCTSFTTDDQPIQIDRTAPGTPTQATSGYPSAAFTCPAGVAGDVFAIFDWERGAVLDSLSGINHFEYELAWYDSGAGKVIVKSAPQPILMNNYIRFIISNSNPAFAGVTDPVLRVQVLVRSVDNAGNTSAWTAIDEAGDGSVNPQMDVCISFPQNQG